MDELKFFHRAVAPTLAEIIDWTGAKPVGDVDLTQEIVDVAPLDRARPGDLVFLDNPKYLEQLTQTRATACLVGERYAARVPQGVAALVAREPYRACAIVTARIYPDATRPGSLFGAHGVSPGANVHPTARLEAGCHRRSGRGDRSSRGNRRGRGDRPQCGDRTRRADRPPERCRRGRHDLQCVARRPGDHPSRRANWPGRFRLRHGARAAISRCRRSVASSSRTMSRSAPTAPSTAAPIATPIIGEGTKIDNLVQIAHNVVIGRHCVIVSQVGISGSTELGDFVFGRRAGGFYRAFARRHGRADRRAVGRDGRYRAGRENGRLAGEGFARMAAQGVSALERLAKSRGGGGDGVKSFSAAPSQMCR